MRAKIVQYSQCLPVLSEILSNSRQDRIQSRYSIHRSTRNEQQKERLLALDFPGVTTDLILQKLVDAESNPGFLDPRNCLVFWARPPRSIRELVGIIQRKLSDIARSKRPRSLSSPKLTDTTP